MDPVSFSTVRPGRAVRARVTDGVGGWEDIFNAKVEKCSATRNPRAKSGRTVNVRLDVVDVVMTLQNLLERRGVATIDGLRWLFAGRGFAFNVNGQVTALGAQTVVAGNASANLWDQVLITRDTNLGYAWVDKAGAVRVFDRASMPAGSVATIGPDVYSSLNTDFDLEQIINQVVVNWLRYDIGTEQSTPVPYGPYPDPDSVDEWGAQQVEITIQGATEVEANIIDYAQDVLDLNATAEVRPRSCVIPMRSVADLALVRAIDLNSRVTVVYHDGVTAKVMRVVRIKHSITTASGWIVELEFALPTGISMPSQTTGSPTSYIPDGAIHEAQLDAALQETITSAAELAAEAVADAEEALNFAESATRTFYQPTMPTEGEVGWTWFDTDDGNRIHVHNGVTYVDPGLARLTDVAEQIEPFAVDLSGAVADLAAVSDLFPIESVSIADDAITAPKIAAGAITT
ncbi:MAG TPA: hypothetical protein VGB85_04285, partial [Nannocystis sp.]